VNGGATILVLDLGLDLMMSILRPNHSMESAAHRVEIIEKLLSYPIDSLEA
jgi:hypothetical protein